jgi:multidrug efflux pump subunit AcrB
MPSDEGNAMWLIRTTLRHPISVVVALIAIALSSVLAVSRMPIDIFPRLNLPVIYVAQPFGGMDAAQMEWYLVYYYEYHFLYITGIQSVESKSIQNVGLLKLTFHPGTDMAQAVAQTIAYVDRARAFMPTGTLPPFVMRFDAGSVPVGYLVFSSESRNPKEIQDVALNSGASAVRNYCWSFCTAAVWWQGAAGIDGTSDPNRTSRFADERCCLSEWNFMLVSEELNAMSLM